MLQACTGIYDPPPPAPSGHNSLLRTLPSFNRISSKNTPSLVPFVVWQNHIQGAHDIGRGLALIYKLLLHIGLNSAHLFLLG